MRGRIIPSAPSATARACRRRPFAPTTGSELQLPLLQRSERLCHYEKIERSSRGRLSRESASVTEVITAGQCNPQRTPRGGAATQRRTINRRERREHKETEPQSR